jgi:hypothetical protein
MIEQYLLVSFSILEEDERILTLTPHGERYERLIAALREAKGKRRKTKGENEEGKGY